MIFDGSFNLSKCDFHTHTVYCDGKNTAEEMVLSAIDKGLECIGISMHSYLDFVDFGSCESLESETKLVEEVAALKEKYKDKIKVLCGLEMDYHSNHTPKGFDYLIGSVHFFEVDGKHYSIDYSPERFRAIINDVFDGDVYAACENYFNNLKNVVEKHSVDIIGHFDLVTKFNEVDKTIDERNPRYVKAWKDAADKLLKYGKPFEINTGAISRGYRTTPYPSFSMIEYIKANGGKLILSSDSHSAKNIAFEYDKWQTLL